MGRPFEPFAQGDFDSLCGVHAIINALYGLCPDMSDRHAEALFNRLIAAIAIRRSNPLQVVWRGMDGSLLRHLLEIATEYVEQKYSVKVTHSRIGQEAQRLTLDQLLEALGQREVRIRREAMVSLRKRCDYTRCTGKAWFYPDLRFRTSSFRRPGRNIERSEVAPRMSEGTTS
jgi:hypothetical protein